MKKYLILAACLCLIFVSACGTTSSGSVPSAPAEVTASPTPEPTPTPVPTVDFLGKQVSLTDLENGYSFELFGEQANTKDTTELHFIRVHIGDEGLDTLRQVLPYMQNLTYLTIDRCDTTDENVAKLREEFKDQLKIAWRVYFDPFSCMTDAVKIWASCDLRDEKTEALKYCNEVRYMDIGHNALHDLWFLEYMPDMEVLIISCSEFEDISEVALCKKLVFLECAETWVRDVSPIAELKDTLEYLNIGSNPNMPPDLSMFECMTKLKRFYCQMYFNFNINMEAEQERFQKLFPDCEVNFDWSGINSAIVTKWRYSRDGVYNGPWNPMYIQIRQIFEYGNPCGSTRLYNMDEIDLDYSRKIYDLDFENLTLADLDE